MGDLENKVDREFLRKEVRFPRVIPVEEYELMALEIAKQVKAKVSYEITYGKVAGDKLVSSPQQPPYVPLIQGVQIKGEFRKSPTGPYIAFIGLKHRHHPHDIPTQLTGLEFCGIRFETESSELATTFESTIHQYFQKKEK